LWPKIIMPVSKTMTTAEALKKGPKALFSRTYTRDAAAHVTTPVQTADTSNEFAPARLDNKNTSSFEISPRAKVSTSKPCIVTPKASMSTETNLPS
jgi:hypothetical protein